MERELDPGLQRIIERSSGHQLSHREEATFTFLPTQSRTAGRSFGQSARQQQQPEMLLDELDVLDSRDYEPINTGLLVASSNSTRLSLAPRNIYNQQEVEQRFITNAENRFKFGQNLRHGMPINLTQQRSMTMQAQSPLSQLATSMLLPAVAIQSQHPPPNLFQGMQMDKFNQLRLTKQQSGFVYSPTIAQAPSMSSPPFAQNSSPTARVSLRRETSRAAPPVQQSRERSPAKLDNSPQTPQRRTGASNKNHAAAPHPLELAHAPLIAHGIRLVSPHELPDRFRQVFPYELFNAAQSKCFSSIYESNDNVVVSAPTGSGKTCLLELAICKLVESNGFGEFKIIYQAPTKSLCSERLRDWQKKFSHLNLLCAELTGDTGPFEMAKVRNASIIVTTPEKWDSITRKWTDFSKLLQMVKLFLIDEVHILKDMRGATLEAVVSRMKSTGTDVRFVALSATVPNSEDIAKWLGKNPTDYSLPARRETFGEEFRPVKLQKHVHGFDGNGNDYAFERTFDGKLPNLIQKYTHKKPIIVFCFTRKSCEKTAAMLAEWWTRQKVVDRAWPAPNQRTVVGNSELLQLVNCGVAFHHAGLDTEDRTAIEIAYLKGDISLICCTGTLAVGVNLPCHLVVLKGTVGFQDGILGEYSDLEVMQMLGRAGRPQFDDSAVAIIMTRSDKVERYKKMISGQELLESTLHLNLIEHLNSEIGICTIRDLATAKKWLTGTFLSVRMRQNPDYYKLEGVPPSRDTDERLRLVCERDVRLLQDNELVTTGVQFTCTEYGLAMSKYMVQFETMKLLLSLSGRAKTEDILNLICRASEFKDLRMKPNERSILRELNKSPFLKYPIKDNVSTTAHKVSIMIQAQLGGIDLPTDKEFVQIRRQYAVDKTLIFDRIQRLIRCVIDCKVNDCDAISTRHALDFSRSLSAGFWEHSNLQLRQIPQIGPAASRKLATGDINSVEKLLNLDTATIERIMGRNPPFGRKILDSVASFPRLTLSSEIVKKLLSKAGNSPKVQIKTRLGYRNSMVPTWAGLKPSVTFMAETSDGTLVHFWRGNIQQLAKGQELKFDVELSGPGEDITCYIACDEIVGTIVSYILKHDLPASAFPPPKEVKQVKILSQPTKTGLLPTSQDEFGGDDFEDAELLEAVQVAEAGPASDYSSDGIADLQDITGGSGERPSSQVATQSVQMANGKWTCNHACRGGKTLKNGHACKHKCCHDGLDKPRKLKRKPSHTIHRDNSKIPRAPGPKSIALGSNSRVMGRNSGSKKAEAPQYAKSKLSWGSDSDMDDIELVDLVDLPKKISLLSEDFTTRFSRKQPQFSDASGARLDLSLLTKLPAHDDIFDSDSGLEEFPPLSGLVGHGKSIADPVQASMRAYQEDPAPYPSMYGDDSMDSLEDAMIGLESSEMLKRTPALRNTTPETASNFRNDVFDFSAFDNNTSTKDVYSSPLMHEVYGTFNCKRARSPALEPPALKYRRVKNVETLENLPEIDRESLPQQMVGQEVPSTVNTPQPPSLPNWVSDMDPELFDDLKDFVDFVD